MTVCCFVRFRIPRTKAEIEANSKRRQLLKNFKAKLRNLKAADLDDMDYRRGGSVLKRCCVVFVGTVYTCIQF